jgi:hypothetical protein
MSANREQGISLAVLLTGFTALPAGLLTRSDYPAVGTFTAIAGSALLIGSLVHMYRIKQLELAEDQGGK